MTSCASMRRNGNVSTSYFQFFLLKHVAGRLLFVVALPAAIYISTFYVHLTLLTKAGPNDDIMTSAFQASLEVPYNLPCNGLFTLPDSDSDSDSDFDSKPNGYIALCKSFRIAQSQIYVLIRQNLCGIDTGTWTDTMAKYRTRLSSHISCSVKV